MRLEELQVLTCEQGSDEWHEARLGIPTASCLKDIMSKGRGSAPSKMRETYMYKLIGERMTGEPSDQFESYATRRGHELEPVARGLYEDLTGNQCDQVGIIVWPDRFGFSPDSIVTDVGGEGLLEIKTKAPHILLPVIEAGEVPEEHVLQCQGGLWVTGLEWIDFVAYYPGCPLFVKRMFRDEKVIQDIEIAVTKFNTDLEAKMNFFLEAA